MNAPDRRRWFRFRLRTLFAVMTLLGCTLAYQLHWLQQRREFLAQETSIREHRLPERGVRIATTSSPSRRPPWAPSLLWALGEGGYTNVFVLADGVTVEKLTNFDWERVRRARTLFPEATVSTVHVWHEGRKTTAQSAVPRG